MNHPILAQLHHTRSRLAGVECAASTLSACQGPPTPLPAAPPLNMVERRMVRLDWLEVLRRFYFRHHRLHARVSLLAAPRIHIFGSSLKVNLAFLEHGKSSMRSKTKTMTEFGTLHMLYRQWVYESEALAQLVASLPTFFGCQMLPVGMSTTRALARAARTSSMETKVQR